MKGEYKVLVDAQQLCSRRHLPLAIGLYFATFYVLNLSFPQHRRRTLTFTQKYVLQITDITCDQATVRENQACTKLMEKINDLKSVYLLTILS